MILTPDLRTVLVHFDGIDGEPARSNGDSSEFRRSDGYLARIGWYVDWVAASDRNAWVLIPRRLRLDGEPWSESLRPERLVRYHDEGDIQVSPPRRRGYAFIINGRQFPIIRWQQAIAAARREGADVLAFGPSETATRAHYAESVLVDSGGSVVRFKRHYCDSPMFTDRWNGEASFLVVRSEHLQAVAAHVVVRGWGLDSVGSLVRRFAVRWSDDPAVVCDDGIDTVDVLGVSTAKIEEGPGAGRIPGDRQSDLRSTGVRVGHGSPSAMFTTDHAGKWFDWNGSAGETIDPRWSSGTDDLQDIEDDRGYLFAKRALDLTVSTLGILLLSPVLIAVAILIKLTSPGPVFFAHIRQGVGGREFPCLKFRSMRTGADAMQAELRTRNEVDGPQFKITNDPRTTPIGKWLRRWNIDELPQLFNVLAGQMSLVGPRPSPDRENQFCPAWRRARLSTKPGITGLWQVLRLRDVRSSDFQEWIYYDVEYARHRSFWLDLNILFYTFPAIFGSRRVKAFAHRLERAGICQHSPMIEVSRPSSTTTTDRVRN